MAGGGARALTVCLCGVLHKPLWSCSERLPLTSVSHSRQLTCTQYTRPRDQCQEADAGFGRQRPYSRGAQCVTLACSFCDVCVSLQRGDVRDETLLEWSSSSFSESPFWGFASAVLLTGAIIGLVKPFSLLTGKVPSSAAHRPRGRGGVAGRGAWPWSVSVERTSPDLPMTLLLLREGREVADGRSRERDPHRDPDRDKGQRNVRHQQNFPEWKST